MISRRLRVDRDEDGDVFEEHKHRISNHGYGKDNVKILHVNRNGPVHSVNELEVSTRLKLYSKKDYIHGDNSDIVATDSQKNTVYILAKQHGIKSPEEFGMLLCNHFITKYRHVKEASVYIEEYPWERIGFGNEPYKKLHNHAFVYSPVTLRYCNVTMERNNPNPIVISGIKNLRVLKTTQSSFVNFIDDEYRSLPDMKDRIFSTIIRSSWEFSTTKNVDFDKVWYKVKQSILDKFAGCPEVGVPSPSVQNTLYLAEHDVLESIPQICAIDMEMPNKHYFTVDLTKFPKVVDQKSDNQDVFLPVDKPAGIIYAQLDRREMKSKL